MNYNDFIMYSSKRTITSNLNQLITEYPDEMHRFSKSYASVNRNVFKLDLKVSMVSEFLILSGS